jgi:hypothetical protein
MPKIYNYRTVEIFNNIKELKMYRNQIANYQITHVKRVKCTNCNSTHQAHKMKVQYGCCANKNCLENGPCE